jgi:hypothetical protein
VQAVKLGDLGKQVVLKGVKSFQNLKQVGDKLTISGDEYNKYNQQYTDREASANAKLEKVRDIPGRLLSDIMAKGGV